jgi:hypothetical protein
MCSAKHGPTKTNLGISWPGSIIGASPCCSNSTRAYPAGEKLIPLVFDLVLDLVPIH